MAGQVDTGASGGGEAPGAADGAVSGASGAAGIGHGDATMVDASADGDPGGAAPAEHSTEATEPQPMDTSAAPLPGDPHDAALARDQSADRGTATSGVDSTDDDPVVQECDVYLNRMYDPPDFVGDMYVLQYPLRPVYRPYGDQGELDRVELKPRSRRLKFVYKLSTGDNFDEDGVATERHGQKHVLSSTVVANPNCSYAVGVIHQGRMTITPIRAVNQLRPDFETFDRLRAQQHSRAASAASADPVAEAMAEAAPAAGGDSSDSGADEPRAVPEADLVAAAPVRVEYVVPGKSEAVATSAAASAEVEDTWTRLDYYSASSEEARDIYRQHIVFPAAAAAEAEEEGYEPDHPKLQKLELDGDREAFLATMCGQAVPRKERKEKREDEPQDGLSAYVLSRMPVERQVEAVVRHFGVVSYSRQLRARLPPSTLRQAGGDEGLFQLLLRCAVLVAGNWVLKSELAGFEGTEAHARDMLLCIMDRKKGMLRREEYERWAQIFERATQRTARDEMTRTVAEYDKETASWRLRNAPDDDFLRRFAKLAEEQRIWWEQHRNTIIRMSQVKKHGDTAAAAAAASSRHRNRLLGEVREVLALGAANPGELRRTLQKKNPTVAIREEEVLQVLQHPDLEAVQVRNLWMLARTGKEDNDKFRSTLIGLFRQRDSVSRKDIMAEYERLHGRPCKLSEYVMRSFIREIAEKADRDNFVLKGTMLRGTSAQ